MSSRFEVGVASAGIVSGMAVATILAPKTSYFFGNFLLYWGPHLCVLVLLLLLRSRPATLAGVSFALALYLATFGAWQFSRQHPQSMAWLGYWSSLPGGAIGAIAAALWLRFHGATRAVVAGSMAAGAVLLCVAANQAVVCSTVMYCGFP